MTDLSPRVLPLEEVRNFRDFGGYSSRLGGTVRRKQLWRAGHSAQATQSDIDAISGLGIALQADLRRPDERERMPHRWTAPETLTDARGRETDAPHQRFLARVEASAGAARGWMHDYYRAAPFRPHHVTVFRGWFEGLQALPEGEAALVNCAAGKDRTGILCALTLHALGVSEADIEADYELTNEAAKVDERLPEATAYYNELLGKDHDGEVYRPFLGVEVDFLRTALEAIGEAHGGADGYLERELGVGAAEREALAARFVA